MKRGTQAGPVAVDAPATPLREISDKLRAIADETDLHGRLGARELLAARSEIRAFRSLLQRAVRDVNAMLRIAGGDNTILVTFRKGDWEQGPYSRAQLVAALAAERDARRHQQVSIRRLRRSVETLEARITALEAVRE